MFRITLPRKSGFTLIELLVVIAIIGVLAGVVIVAVNPVDQLAKSRDTARISTISQLGRSLEAYHSSKEGAFPAVGTTWMSELASEGDLRGNPGNLEYFEGVTCNDEATNGQNGYCYKHTANDSIIYAQLESATYNNNCSETPNTRAYFVYSYANARSCGVCGEDSTDIDADTATVCDF